MRGNKLISSKNCRAGLLAGALFLAPSLVTLPLGGVSVLAANALGSMQSQIKAQQKNLQLSQTELATLSAQLKADERAISAAAAKLNDTKAQLRKNERTLGDLEGDKAELEQQAAQQKKLLAKQAESAFVTGHYDYLKLLLNQQDPAKLSRSLDYYDHLNKARIAAINALKTTQAQLEANRSARQNTEDELKALLAVQQAQHETLITRQKSRAKTRRQLQQSVQDDQQKLSRLIKAEKALKARLEALRRQRVAQEQRERQERERLAKRKAELARQAAEAAKPAEKPLPAPEPLRKEPMPARGHYAGLSTSQQLNWPVQGPILIAYGAARTAELKWKGTLIGAAEGAQVKAVAPGQVVYADWLDGFGMLLVLDHGQGYMSLYGHNQSLLRRVGQNVEQSEPIALVGDTGGQSRAGLYFELRYQGEAINPAKWLAKH
ncbi:MAG: murein hydrolase activator EnvC [Aeromonas sp.]